MYCFVRCSKNLGAYNSLFLLKSNSPKGWIGSMKKRDVRFLCLPRKSCTASVSFIRSFMKLPKVTRVMPEPNARRCVLSASPRPYSNSPADHTLRWLVVRHNLLGLYSLDWFDECSSSTSEDNRSPLYDEILIGSQCFTYTVSLNFWDFFGEGLNCQLPHKK